MGKSPLKVKSATVKIVAYDGNGNVVDSLDTYSRLTPSVQLLEFMMDCEDKYPTIVRYEMTVAY